MKKSSDASGSMVYCLGIIGALVYYVGEAANIGEGLIGILKSLVWPAFFVYEFLSMVGA